MSDALPQDRPVQLWKMTRRQFREGIYDGNLKGAIIPTGSTEQHNEHLEMSHDTASAVHVSERAAQALYPEVVVTTPLAIGVSEHWMDHNGTLTTRPEIFTELLYDVADSMKRGGINHILAVNGHAGNAGPVNAALEDIRSRLGVNFSFCSYWEAYTPENRPGSIWTPTTVPATPASSRPPLPTRPSPGTSTGKASTTIRPV